MMKKVCLIDQGEIFGGAECFALDFIKASQGKVELFLCTSTDLDERYKKALEAFPHIKKFQTYFPSLRPLSFQSLWIFTKAAWGLLRFVKKHRIEYLYSNTVRGHMLGAVVSFFSRVPLLWMLHDVTFPAFFMKRLSFIPVHIAGVSEMVLNFVRSTVGRSVEKKLMVIPNGIFTDEELIPDGEALHDMYGKKFIFEKEKRYVTLIGRIDIWKGQDVFLKAVAHLKSNGTLPADMEFLVVGDVTRTSDERIAFAKNLELFVETEHLTGIVHFLGHQTLANILPRSFILVQASTAPEPFGRTLIEAFSAGVPVITSRLGAAEKIVTYGRTGLTFDPGSSEDLAQKILFMQEDKNLYSTCVVEGKREVEQKYSMKRVIELFIEVFSEKKK